MTYRATRSAALVLCAALMLAVSGLPASAKDMQDMRCWNAVSEAWKAAGVVPSDVSTADDKSRTAGGTQMPETTAYARLKSCSGTLVVNLSKTCHVRDVYTTGDCRLEGVAAYP